MNKTVYPKVEKKLPKFIYYNDLLEILDVITLKIHAITIGIIGRKNNIIILVIIYVTCIIQKKQRTDNIFNKAVLKYNFKELFYLVIHNI